MGNEADVREQICEIGKRIYDRGMVAANDGNISVRLDDNTILCTPTGVSKGFMTPESICRIDDKGKVIEAADGFRPSSEIKMHLRVYEKRPDAGAVLHAHPPFATAFAVAGIPLDQPIMTEAVVALGCVPIAEYGTPSTSEIPDRMEKYLPFYDALLLESHGALAWGSGLFEAWQKMESVEFYAQLMYRTRALGGAKVLDDEKVERLYEVRRSMNAPGRHPATFCPDGETGEEYKGFPGYQYDFVGKGDERS